MPATRPARSPGRPRRAPPWWPDGLGDRGEIGSSSCESVSATASRPPRGGLPSAHVAEGRKVTISEETAKQYLGRVREKYSRAGRAAPTKVELYYRAVEDGHLPPLP